MSKSEMSEGFLALLACLHLAATCDHDLCSMTGTRGSSISRIIRRQKPPGEEPDLKVAVICSGDCAFLRRMRGRYQAY